MNDIIINPDPKLVHMSKVVQNQLTRKFSSNPAQSTTLITKTQGGVGADTLASILAYVFEERGLIAPIFQAGGTKGPLCKAYQRPRFNRVPLNDPLGAPLAQQLAKFLTENAGRPAIAIISPEANALALSIITAIASAQLPIKFHNIHLVRPPSNLSLMEELRPFCVSSTVAMVEPLTYPPGYDQMMLIPQLPGELIDGMEERHCTFRAAMDNADVSLKLPMHTSFERFSQQLVQFYA